MGERREWLRTSIAGEHSKLDFRFGNISSHEDYRDYLLFTARFRQSVEGWLQEAAAADPDVTRLAIWPFVERDCGDLGLYPRPPDIILDVEPSSSAVLGVTYVLQGACLGAYPLWRVARRLGLGGDRGARHLERQVQTAGRWPAFLVELETDPIVDMRVMVRAAQAVMALARQALEAERNGTTR
ncbi:MAG: biliverdin-producing heme oxygenase [Hyphomicrobiaceae bacterium]